MEQFPGGPREEKSSTAWRIAMGCGVGCLFVLIVAGVACGLVCRHVGQRTSIDRAQTVLTGDEIGHASFFVTESDPGMSAIRKHLERAAERMAESTSRPGRRMRADLSGAGMVLPVRLQVRAYPPAGSGTEPTLVGEAELSGSYNVFGTMLRLMGRERREALASGASLYTFPDDEGGFFLGVAGNRFVVSRSREAIVPLVDGSHAMAPVRAPDDVRRLVEAARLPTEDGAAWARGAFSPDLAWANAGALSLDLTSEDTIAFVAVFEVPPGLPKEESAKRVEAWIREQVPDELTLSMEKVEWLDARTVRAVGALTGLAAALDQWVRHPERER